MATITFLQAQTSQGNFMIGGGFGFSSQSRQNNNDYVDNYTYLEPSVGYFVIDNLAVGLNLFVGGGKFQNGVTDQQYSDFGVGPFVRYYVPTSNEKFSFYGQASFFFVNETFTNNVNGDKFREGESRFSIAPGFTYFFTPHWGLDVGLTLFSVVVEDPDRDNNNNNRTYVDFGLNSLSPNLGVRYFFGGK